MKLSNFCIISIILRLNSGLFFNSLINVEVFSWANSHSGLLILLELNLGRPSGTSSPSPKLSIDVNELVINEASDRRISESLSSGDAILVFWNRYSIIKSTTNITPKTNSNAVPDGIFQHNCSNPICIIKLSSLSRFLYKIITVFLRLSQSLELNTF